LNVSFNADFVGPWVSEKTGGTWTKGRGTAIGKLGTDGQIIAGVLYEDWNGVNVVCHIAGIGNWATKEFLNLIFDYPFNRIGAKRITTPISSDNEKSINLVLKMGFELECRLRKATPFGDLLLFCMFAENCKYIKGKYGKV
jgi:RimJ/RimL family protein N-acetyltransferase